MQPFSSRVSLLRNVDFDNLHYVAGLVNYRESSHIQTENCVPGGTCREQAVPAPRV